MRIWILASTLSATLLLSGCSGSGNEAVKVPEPGTAKRKVAEPKGPPTDYKPKEFVIE